MIVDSMASSQWQDPAFFEDNDVFLNLILKENNTNLASASALLSPMSPSGKAHRRRLSQPPNNSSSSHHLGDKKSNVNSLSGQPRHLLLSWMVDICDTHRCQDEIFPLAATILDKFLATTYSLAPTACTNYERQVHLFGACCLLIASKLRQTPCLEVRALLDASGACACVVPQLTRDELLDAELLVLTCLKWDLASIVVPNDFVELIARKCVAAFWEHGCCVGGLRSSSSRSPDVKSANYLSAKRSRASTTVSPVCVSLSPSPCSSSSSSSSSSWNLRRLALSTSVVGKPNLLAISSSTLLTTPTYTPPAKLSHSVKRRRLIPCALSEELDVSVDESIASVWANKAAKHKQKINETIEKTDANEMITQQQQQQQQPQQDSALFKTSQNHSHNQKLKQANFDEHLVREQTRKLIELSFLMDESLSNIAPSLLAMACMAVAISGLKPPSTSNTTSEIYNNTNYVTTEDAWHRLRRVVAQIHIATHCVKDLNEMIDVAIRIETLLVSSHSFLTQTQTQTTT